MKLILTFVCLLAFHSQAMAVVIWVDADRGDDAAAGTEQAPMKSITAAVARALTPGDVVRVREGIYRREKIRFAAGGTENAPITLEAAPGAKPIVRGSIPVTGWTKLDPAGQDRPIYSAAWSTFLGEWDKAYLSDPQGNLKRHDARKMGRNQLFVDGQYIEEVPRALDLKPGSVYLDRSGGRMHLWLADGSDPTARLVEATSTEGPLLSTWGHDHLVVRGLAFEHCGNRAAANGMVRVAEPEKPHAKDKSARVLVEDCTFRFSNGTGLFVSGEDNIIRNCHMTDNAQSGMLAAGSKRLLVQGGSWMRNNTLPGRRYDHGWEASNKIATTRETVIDGVEVAYNSGFGIWADGDNRDVHIRNCNVHHNLVKGAWVSGIRYELGYTGYIYNNIIHHNDLGISIDASSGCWVFNNTIYGNADSAMFVGGSRVWNNKDPNLHGKTQRAYGNKIFNNLMADNGRASKYKKSYIFSSNVQDPSFNPPKFPDSNGVVPFAQNWSDHNLFWTARNNASYGATFFGYKGGKAGGNLADYQSATQTELHSIWMQDPKLADPAAGDFRLLSNSPAAGKGTLMEGIPEAGLVDRAGRPRKAGQVDLGAYQLERP
jgi:parallel beta-helix repeat protein